MLNREQRRKLNRKYKVNYSADEWAMIELYSKIRAGDLDVKDLNDLTPELRENVHIDNEELVPEGTPVRLNAAEILSRPRKGVTEKYLKWVDEHRDVTFHVTRDQANSSLVCLQEDVEECRMHSETLTEVDKLDHLPWLFDIYSDLLYDDNGEWKILEFIERNNKRDT